MTPEQQPQNGSHGHVEQGPGPPAGHVRRQSSNVGLSSHGTSHKRPEVDRSDYAVGQTLVAVVNDPRADAQKNWGTWLGLGFRVPDVSWQEPPPPIDSMRYPPISHRDLAKYLALVSEGRYKQFQQDRQSLAVGGIAQQLGDTDDDDDEQDDEDGLAYLPYGQSEQGSAEGEYSAEHGRAGEHGGSSGGGGSSSGMPPGPSTADGDPQQPQQQREEEEREEQQQLRRRRRERPPRLKQGDGLVTALQVVPPLFFNEDFSLSRPDIFEAICGCEDDGEMYERIDKLSAALDLVETQLMREIASRSRAIMGAGSCVHHLHARVAGTRQHVQRIRDKLSDMDEVTYSATLRVAALQRRRGNLAATLELVKQLEEVAAARAALPLLLESGDYAAGLELLDNLSHAAGALVAGGVRCLASLAPQLVERRGEVEAALQAELLGA
ncbi:hypothetical protein Agub_g5757, partial [Astrephomene gubernaculifera]